MGGGASPGYNAYPASPPAQVIHHAPAPIAAAPPGMPLGTHTSQVGGFPTLVSYVPYVIGGTATVYPSPQFNPNQQAEILRRAMKGIGTDEKTVIHVMSSHSTVQLQQITLAFKTIFGRDLMKDLKSELSGNFRKVVRARFRSLAEYDAACLHKAMRGAGTDESCLIEILCTRSNPEIHMIRDAYYRKYNKDLERVIASETSFSFKRLLVSLVQGNRSENHSPDFHLAYSDAMELYRAGEGRWGTDESMFNKILCQRSFPQLHATFAYYSTVAKGSTIERAIEREFSGDIRRAMLTIVRSVCSRAAFFAEQLHKSMKGIGTNDRTLIRIVVSRCEIDMGEIKAAYQALYNRSLASAIHSDTSGHYRQALLALVK
ncbi:hypothetical protein H696_02685 [Fonticula alba]|uniref:Annexin n=1 Tax=Fonticula alba TaxID=691883 RepID=A0A058Z8V5_FONAL|nr:hypothetical protein H696_02685 [Fonticula alba]KCV70358.1 hypothetical protein H696_02685 [Fonticula alba]|eukprot:XP_009494874.1 hypothetical protein H696_02685 [Fonticula alba]